MTQDNLLKTIGNNIKDARKERGMKGETLAKELGVTKGTISQIENGCRELKIYQLCSIANILETDVRNLIPANIIYSKEQVLDQGKMIFIEHVVFEQFITHAKTLEKLACR